MLKLGLKNAMEDPIACGMMVCNLSYVDKAIQFQLHFFSDASNLARGTVCYLRMILPDSTVRCNLLMSYIRGCSKTTISQMELEGMPYSSLSLG